MSSGADERLRSLAPELIARLRDEGATLATAESCSGGLIAGALTGVPGASDVFWGGGVVYTSEAKLILTGLEPDVLELHGMVSARTSEALAAAIRTRSGATYGLAVTGWAGPTADDGGLVGEVHAALSHAGGGTARSWRFDGDRDAIRAQAAAAALAILQEHLDAPQDGDHE